MKQFVYIVNLSGVVNLIDLLLQRLFIGLIGHIAYDAQCHGIVGITHSHEHHVYARIGIMSVVNENIPLGPSVLTYGNYTKPQTLKHKTLIAILTEYHGFSVTKRYGTIFAPLLISELIVRFIIEYHTVLQYFGH